MCACVRVCVRVRVRVRASVYVLIVYVSWWGVFLRGLVCVQVWVWVGWRESLVSSWDTVGVWVYVFMCV